MQQTCPKCGFTAELNAKFCRQCGTNLVNEGGGSEAQTQHYGRQTPPPVPEPASSPFTTPMPHQPPPPSIADTFTPDTAQLRNQAPQQSFAPPQPSQPYGQGQYPAVPPYGQPMGDAKPKSNWWKWALGGVLGSVLLCGGCVTYGLFKAQEMGQGLQQKIETAVTEAQKAAEADAARQVPQYGPDGKPLPPPPPPAPGSDVSPDISKLSYPNAKQSSHVKAMGQEVLTLTSEATMEELKTFYQKEMGDPTVESNSDNERTVLFQKGQVTVSLTTSNEPGVIDINIIRSNFIPNLKQTQQQ